MNTQLFAAAPRPHISARKGAIPQRCSRVGALLLIAGLLLPAQSSYGMSWNWAPIADTAATTVAGKQSKSSQPAGERLRLTLDSPGQVHRLLRTGNTLLLYLDDPSATLERSGAAPSAGALLDSIGLSNGQLRITLSPKAVNHVMRRSSPSELDIEIFAAGPQKGENSSRLDAAGVPVGNASADSEGQGASFAVNLPADAAVGFLQKAQKLLGDVQQGAAGLLDAGKAKLADLSLKFTSLGSTKTAEAAEVPQAAGSAGNRAVTLDGQSLMSRVNPGGPENWPDSKGLSTSIPSNVPVAAPATAATSAPAVPVAPASQPGTQPATQPVTRPAAQPAPAPQNGVQRAVPPAAQPQAQPAPQPVQQVVPQAIPQPALQPASQPAPQPAPQVKAAPAQQPAPAAASAPAPVAGQAKPNGAGGNVSGKVSDNVVGLPHAEEKGGHGAAAPKEEPRPVVYVDEQGNPVAKPADPEKMMDEAERLIKERKFVEALPQLEKLKEMPTISADMRLKTLYYISDCVWARYADNPLAGFEPIVSATSEAMNFDLRSPRVPEALLRLGLVNVNVGNLVDAGGYIVAMYRRYPDYPGVAQGFTALGKAQLKRRMDAQAEQSFAIVLDKYPESSFLQEASVGLAQALNNQRKYTNAQVILDFISKRWPRYYIEDPTFLFLQGANDEALDKPVAALTLYWLYYNLVPGQKGNDDLLLKMGDMYTRLGNKSGAEFLYSYLTRHFAGTHAANMASLRLAEGGIYDSPINYEAMTQVFARAASGNLPKVYANLAAASRTAPESVLARLKEAMWLYWSKRYTEAMGKAADFIDGYPENANVAQARDIIWLAFQKELANSMAEKNYGRILILWNGFPLVRERYGAIDPRMRYALAQGLLERGETEQALGMLAEFLKSPMDPQYGEATFTEFFNRYLQAGAWAKILDLGKLVATWPLNPQLRNQLDYAMALSAQNLNLNGAALAMWQKLAERQDIPLYQRAYATYFLARDAEQRKDIRNSYTLNRKVIDLFTQLQNERSDKADPQRIKDAILSLMDICEVGNRVPEALEWLARYNAFVPKESPEYPGLRFREARLYRKLGDATRAQALLEDIVRNYADSPFAKAATAELHTFEVSRDLQNYLPGGAGSQAAPAAKPAAP
ncbi:tetratricopeptide repeat protein [Desulfovibrio desulfuricans]|uniref:tetratricopeptide repeat protein n=1 Tax=Desulfovibrio desulfuricans TaxID=876 RepID=UPI002B1F1A27|nr:tetratricopeptide repeat protein [Desulfovibrio desulfuricans]MEA4990214.1 tetratricopeptide repeat protein [Desulfovibrio desulfuricans]